MSLNASLTDNNFSILLSRLQRIETSLNSLEEVRKILKDIEDNTRVEDTKSVFRQVVEDKVTVGVRTSIISVGDIDTVAQQFKCDFYISATWQEPQLMGRNVQEEIDWKNEWHPRIVFFNAIEIEKMEKNHYLFYEDGNTVPFVMETYRIKGSFRENLELWDFPMDYQQLTITLMSDWTNKMVEFEKDMRRADTIRPETFTAVQEWSLCNHVVTESTSTVKTEGSSVNDYPLYHIKCHVKRKNGYYLWNIAMIIFLIGLLSFCSFSVDISEPADRLSVTLTLLLTAVAFKFVVSQSLPTISYLTLLDKYVLSGLVFLCFMAIENAIAAVITDNDTQMYFDQICFYIGIGVFVFFQVFAIIILLLKAKDRNLALGRSANLYRERQVLIKQRQQMPAQKPPKDEAMNLAQDKLRFVQSKGLNDG